MKAAGAILAVAVALAIQTTLARFLVRGSVAVDLVLVVTTPMPAHEAGGSE